MTFDTKPQPLKLFSDCYTCGLLTQRKHGMVLKLLHVIPSSTYADKWCISDKSAGAIYNNVLTNCATLLYRACVDLTACVAVFRLMNCERLRKTRNGNPTAVPYFERSPVLVCTRLGKQRETGVQEGETAGVYLWFPRRNRRSPAAGAAIGWYQPLHI